MRWAAGSRAALGIFAVGCRSVMPAGGAPADGIRAARAAYAAAWNAADTAALHRAWMGTFRLHQQHGVEYAAADLLAQAVRRQGGAPQPTRTYQSGRLQVYAPRGLALETGTYVIAQGDPAASGFRERGVYVAQWKADVGGWKLLTEVLSPTACQGAAAWCGGL